MAKPRRATVPSMRIHDFLALVHEGMQREFGADVDGFTWRQRFGYLQYYRATPAVHFEIWVQKKTQRLEIGLHFEGERAANYAAAELLSIRAGDIAAAVGPEFELEEWTAVWTRLHRAFPAPALTPELADEAATRAAQLIRGIEPILDQMEIAR